MSVAEAIEEVSKIFSSFFNYETVAKEKQAETTVIKGGKNKAKAVEYAEKIIFLVDDLVEKKAEEKTQKKYKKLRKNFFKYN